jgi:hypothetical protein
MDPKILQAMSAIAQAMQGSHPNEAQQIQRWVQAGGNYALPASILMLALPIAPTIGVPAAAIMAGIKSVQGAPATDTGTRGIPMSVPGQRPPNTTSPNGPSDPTTGPGTIGYRGAVAGPSGIGADNPSPFDNNQPGGAPGVGNSVKAQVAAGPTGDLGSETAPSAAGLPNNPGATYNANNTPPTPAATGGGDVPGGFSANQANVLGEDSDYLLRFALKAAGFDPDVATPAEKIAAKYLAPMVEARRSAYGLMDPSGGNKQGLPQDIVNFAQEYSKPGANFYGNAAKYAQGILGGQGFQGGIAGIGDQEQRMAMYQALIPLLYGGSNPLIQQSTADQTKKLFNQYKDQDIQGGPNHIGIFEDFVKQQQNLSPILRSIFGGGR